MQAGRSCANIVLAMGAVARRGRLSMVFSQVALTVLRRGAGALGLMRCCGCVLPFCRMPFPCGCRIGRRRRGSSVKEQYCQAVLRFCSIAAMDWDDLRFVLAVAR